MLRLFHIKSVVSLLVVILSLAVVSACSTLTNETDKSVVVDPEQLKNAAKLNQLADIIYNYVNDENMNDARSGLNQLAEQITNIRFQGLTTIEGMEALAASVISAKEVFNTIRFSQQEAVWAAGQIRLATDALTHPKNPMWLGYYKILKDDGERLRTAIAANDKDFTGKAIVQISSHYSMIRPAALINRSPSEVEKVDSFMTFLNSGSISTAMNQYDEIWIEFFRIKTSTAYLPLVNEQNPILWSIGVGGIILSVLGFVGWRRYRIEQDLIAVQQKSVRDRGW